MIFLVIEPLLKNNFQPGNMARLFLINFPAAPEIKPQPIQNEL